MDDDHRPLYKRNDSTSEFFYHRKNPLKHSLITKKVLYVVFNKTKSFPNSITFLDTFGQEWDLLSDSEIGNFDHPQRPTREARLALQKSKLFACHDQIKRNG